MLSAQNYPCGFPQSTNQRLNYSPTQPINLFPYTSPLPPETCRSMVNTMRHYSLLDRFLMEVDQSLRTVHGRPPVTERPNPADVAEEAELSEKERALAGRLSPARSNG